MKTSLITSILVLGILGASMGAKPGKTKGKGNKEGLRAAAEALRGFDKNGNKTVDGEELAAVKKSFAEAPSGPLAALDKNKDAKLDDDEIKAASGRRVVAALIREMDKDANHKIEGAEAEALRKKLEADPKGALSQMDRNGNAKLDDDELAKINERLAARAAETGTGKKSKKSKKNAPAATPAKTEEPKPAAKVEEVKKPETEAK